MLIYNSTVFANWIYSNTFWGTLITGHLLFIVVPGFVAMVVEPPRLFGFGRRSKVVPLVKPQAKPEERPLQAA